MSEPHPDSMRAFKYGFSRLLDDLTLRVLARAIRIHWHFKSWAIVGQGAPVSWGTAVEMAMKNEGP